MKAKMMKAVTVAALISVGLSAHAGDRRGTRDPGVNARQQHQKERIRQGVKSGELTKHEAKGLREEHRDIKQLEQAYKSDGTLTNAERRDLHHELNQQSRDIYQQKHDGQQRFGGTGVGNPGTSGIGSPGTRDPLVNARQQSQADRVRQGMRSGGLTRHEAKELIEEGRDIKQLEQAYKSDGTLTGAERKDLHQELNQLGHDIRQEKHDAQQR